MKAVSKSLAFASCLALSFGSCEIEDEYSNPTRLEKPGTELTKTYNPPLELFWSDITNEIIIITIDGIIAINAESKAERRTSNNNNLIAIGSATLSGETLYLMNQASELSTVNINSLSQSTTFVDSVSYPWSTPANSTHLVYSKYTLLDQNEPSLFLVELKSRKETRIAAGQPALFSPDGKQLIFKNNAQFYSYDLTTKEILSLGIYDNSGFMILMWTTDGILSFDQQGEYISIRNETTNVGMGQFKTAASLYKGDISNTGKHIITTNHQCAYPGGTRNCMNTITEHAIVNIESKTLIPMARVLNAWMRPRAISPDEKKIVYSTPDNRIFIAESLN